MKGNLDVRLSHGAALRGWLVAVALGALSLTAAAFNADRYTDLEWSTAGDSAKFTPTQKSSVPSGRSFGSMPGGPAMQGSKTLPWPGKSQAQNMAKWKGMATPRNLAKSIVNPVGAVGGFLATTAIVSLLDTACIRVFGGSMVLKENNSWEECVFNSSAAWHVANYTGTDDVDATASCKRAASEYTIGGYPKGTFTANSYASNINESSSPPTATCNYMWNATQTWGSDPMTKTSTVVQRAGWKPAEMTSSQVEDVVEAQIASQAAADYAACPEGCSRPTQQVMNDLIAAWKVELEGPYASGPNEFSDTPRVTTQNVIQSTPTGTTTATLTTTTIDKYLYTYEGDKVTTKKATTETKSTTNVDGQTTTETNTEAPAGDPNKDDSMSECDKSPDTVGCGKLDLPTEEVPRSTRAITYAEDDVGLGAGSCPEPIEFGTGRTFTFTLLCDKLILAKPMIIAMASFTALLIVLGIKSEGGP